MSLKHSKEEELIEPRTAPTLKEDNPTRVILRDLTIADPCVSINQRKRLLDIAKIGGGAPSTIRKGNFMECT